jgi:hypothetical protein
VAEKRHTGHSAKTVKRCDSGEDDEDSDDDGEVKMLRKEDDW